MSRTHTGDAGRGFVTIEVLLSLGLAAIAFATFSVFFNSLRHQQRHQQTRAAAVFLLQAKLEEVRRAWPTGNPTGAPQPIAIGSGQFSWQLTTVQLPRAGQFCAYQVAVLWQENGREHQVTATSGRIAQ